MVYTCRFVGVFCALGGSACRPTVFCFPLSAEYSVFSHPGFMSRPSPVSLSQFELVFLPMRPLLAVSLSPSDVAVSRWAYSFLPLSMRFLMFVEGVAFAKTSSSSPPEMYCSSLSL